MRSQKPERIGGKIAAKDLKSDPKIIVSAGKRLMAVGWWTSCLPPPQTKDTSPSEESLQSATILDRQPAAIRLLALIPVWLAPRGQGSRMMNDDQLQRPLSQFALECLIGTAVKMPFQKIEARPNLNLSLLPDIVHNCHSLLRCRCWQHIVSMLACHWTHNFSLMTARFTPLV